MSWYLSFWGLFVVSAGATGEITDGLCQFTMGPGGLSQALCKLPNCPTGGDCAPPSINLGSTEIRFIEPLLQWKDACPSIAITGGCWEVYMDFILKMAATDPSGMSEIGVNIAQNLEGKQTVKKYASPAVKTLSDGRYEINGGMVLHVPGGRPVELSVTELCAKDAMGNAGCIAAR